MDFGARKRNLRPFLKENSGKSEMRRLRKARFLGEREDFGFLGFGEGLDGADGEGEDRGCSRRLSVKIEAGMS